MCIVPLKNRFPVRKIYEYGYFRDMRNAYSILFWKSYERKPIGRARSIWDNIRLDRRERGWKAVDRLHLVQDSNQWRAVVNSVMNLRVYKRREIS
jgi:hypothetical protein